MGKKTEVKSHFVPVRSCMCKCMKTTFYCSITVSTSYLIGASLVLKRASLKTYYPMEQPSTKSTQQSKNTYFISIAATGALKTNCRDTHGPPSSTHFDRKDSHLKVMDKMKAQENIWWTKWFGTQPCVTLSSQQKKRNTY